MVPNGDFSQYDDYEIPIEYWFSNYNKDFIIKTGYINNILRSRYDSFLVFDIYKSNFIGTICCGGGLEHWLKGPNSLFLLSNWFPFTDSNNNKINFDSIIFQDTFHFTLKNQYENTANYFLSNYCSFKPGTNVSKVRVCGKNLYPLTSPLSYPTKTGAYYKINLDLMYDRNTFIYTMIYKNKINDTGENSLDKQFPFLHNPQNARPKSIWSSTRKSNVLVELCNITLDSNHYSRNNNFKITLLNTFFKDTTSNDANLNEQDVWGMPLFPEVDEGRNFKHRFKANQQYRFLQLRQKQKDSIQYYLNDTLPFPDNNDSLFNLITDKGLHTWTGPPLVKDGVLQSITGQPGLSPRFHPLLGHWPYVKQWFYPGKFRRYADKTLRNADYFLDNLSLKPEMYHQTPIAAPSSLCHKDTFLAFLPSGENATWTDLFTGEVLSQSDSCWIHLVDKVLIQVKGPNFTDTLKYSLEKPKSPFEKDIYSLCLGDSLNFVAEPGYTAQWQFGTIHSNNYTHHYTDTSVLQVTYNSDLGCEHHFTSTVIKGPNPNQFNIDTAFCNQQQFLWEIPSNNWVFIPQSGIVQNATHLVFNTARDVQMFVNLVDTLSNCPVSLDVNIRSNEVPDLDIPSDTTLCFSTPFDVPLPDAAWYRLDGTNINPPIIIDSTGNFLLIAGNRNCTDTAAFAIFKYPEIKVNIQQYNPWTCYLDSPLIFNAAPPSYQYYWKGSTTADSIYFTQDTQHIQLLVIDSHQCEKTYFVQPDYSCFKPVWIPNVFTPDGRGPNENERFAASCASCQTTYMRIYNRWGEMIYSGIEPWDGTYQGMLVPNGVYAYVIGVEISFGTQKSLQHFKGSVQVLR
jgi:gliding motility-associated-like protein